MGQETKPAATQAPRKQTLGRALHFQVGLIAAIATAVVVSASAYFGQSTVRREALKDALGRLDGYHEAMSYMVEDVDYDGAARVAHLLDQDPEIGDYAVINRFGKRVVEHGNAQIARPGWQIVSLPVLDVNGVGLAMGYYQVREPTISREGYFWIIAFSLGAAAIIASFALAIVARLQKGLVGPIRALHRDIGMAAAGGAFSAPDGGRLVEVTEMSVAIGDAFRNVELAAFRNRHHISVLTNVLSNFGVAIRYIDQDGKHWDYGQIDSAILPAGAPAPADRSAASMIAALRAAPPPGFSVDEIDLQTRAHDSAALQLECRSGDSIHEVTLFDLGAGEYAISVADVSRARNMENSALESQRFEIVGQLSSGIAHDFNNILGVILGNAQLAEAEFEDPALREFIDPITAATERGANLTRSLLSFAREARLEAKVLDLNRTVDTIIGWSSRVLPASIKTDVVLQSGAWPVCVDPTMTESALLNLMLNARDAMPDGGKLTVETANVVVDEQYLAEHKETLPPGRYTMLSVTDTGTGIPKSKLKLIFDPFYTTKGPGKGSGLGLSMIFGFVSQSGGFVRVCSEEGVGTTFKLIFPSVPDQNLHHLTELEHVTETSVGAHVLLVEDEDPLRFVMQEHLRHAGYDVLVARDAEEAIELACLGNQIDVVVTDIVMPGELNGIRMVQKLRKAAPKLAAVFLSGYLRDPAVDGDGIQSQDIRLTKPVRRDELIDAIEKALCGRA